MTFNEAMTGLLAGKKVRKATWPATEYIYLAGNLVLTDNNKRYQMNRVDMEANWEILAYEAGTILKHNNSNFYKLIICPDNTYSIVNTETYMVVREHIRGDMLELLLGVEGYTPLHMCDFNL